MIRKLYSLPEDVVALLDKETNKSDTVAKAVRLYLTNRDASRRIISLADRLEDRLAESTNKQLQPVGAPQTGGRQHGYVNPYNRKQRWNAFSEEWEPNE